MHVFQFYKYKIQEVFSKAFNLESSLGSLLFAICTQYPKSICQDRIHGVLVTACSVINVLFRLALIFAVRVLVKVKY